MVQGDLVLVIGQPTGGLEHQRGGLLARIELHAGHNLLGVDGRVLRSQIAGVRLQWALVPFSLAEDRACGQDELHHISLGVALQHHGQLVLVLASTAVAVTRTSYVLWAVSAACCLRCFGVLVRSLTVGRCAVRCSRGSIRVVGGCIELAAHLWRSLDDDDVQVALINAGDFFAFAQQTEHTATNGDAFAAANSGTTRQGAGVIRQHVVTCKGGDFGWVECSKVAHGSLLTWFGNTNLKIAECVETGGNNTGVVF